MCDCNLQDASLPKLEHPPLTDHQRITPCDKMPVFGTLVPEHKNLPGKSHSKRAEAEMLSQRRHGDEDGVSLLRLRVGLSSSSSETSSLDFFFFLETEGEEELELGFSGSVSSFLEETAKSWG